MKQCLITLFALLSFSFLQAQSVISGSVKDTKGVGIVGATVLVTGSNNGAATDIDGNFRIDNVSGTAVSLTVSSVGYTTQVVKVDFAGRNSASVQVVLVEDYKLLDEVVVVAYGTRKEKISPDQ